MIIMKKKSKSKKEALRKMDKFLKNSKLTEEDAIKFGREITKKAARRFQQDCELNKETVEEIKKAKKRMKNGKIVTEEEARKRIFKKQSY